MKEKEAIAIPVMRDFQAITKIVIATHDPTVAAQTKRIINMQDSMIIEAVKIGE